MSVTIEAFGSTSLIEDGSYYFLQPNGGSAVVLSYGGSPVVVGQYGPWVPIAAEQTASGGYQVVWKLMGADQYLAWNTDSNGNCVSGALDPTSGTSAALQSIETSFHQDLNGDGLIGPSSSTVIESFGSTSLVQAGTSYFLDPTGGPAVELSYGGAPVVVGQFGLWTPIGAERTASGYEVALKMAGADDYTVWYTDSSGNYVSSAFGNASGMSATVESFETSFQQDLNSDGLIGPPSMVIESFGSTSLVQAGSNYFLNPTGGSSVELSSGGAPIVASQLGQWVPIAAEQTASGYEVALKATGADLYTVWYTDSSGNYVSTALNSVSGTSAALQSLETSFHQDLNGDGLTGSSTTVIESFGSTSLVQAGINYFLNTTGGSSVELSYGGSPVVAGQFGLWTPIAAEQTASGYEVALKVTGADQYTVWYTDSSGNYVSSAFNSASGTSVTLELLESSFQQDLNGDGLIGPPSTVIESFGPTSLTEAGSNYFLNPTGGSSVVLSSGGAPIEASQLGQWAPIAAEQTASGYEVALKMTGADDYIVWYTDSRGNYVSTALNSVSGTSAALESFETSFHQDLNGDGLISPSSTVIESFGSTSLEAGLNYFLNSTSGSSVELSYGGSPVVAGQFGLWTPIAAEQTASGYEVALKVTGADQYTVWYTDSSGNYVSSAFNSASGTSATVESFETSFQQDLNGDGLIGPPTTMIENFGSTSLVQIGSNYFLNTTGGSSVELSYGGSPVVAGQFGLWTPIAAEQTASGYEVALKETGADHNTVFYTDASGNYVSSPFETVSGTSAAMESLEPSFHQDLNSDGVIGMPPMQFVYQGVDADGAQVYSITAPNSGLWPIEVRVLTPDNPSTNYQHNFLYALPVEGGTNPKLGDGLHELEKLDVQDNYNATIIEPIFPTYSWYANSATDVTLQYETFMATVLPAWVESNFSISGTEKNLLIGFSKSGYGGLDLLFKHPDVFSAVSAWDFPADMTSYNQFTASMNYGTEANFQNNYRLTADFIDTYKAPFTTQDRIFISGYSMFKTDVKDFDALLTAHGVQHELSLTPTAVHSWTSGWLSGAVAGLYGLETDLAQTTIENAGSTSLVQGGSNYFLYPNGGSEVELKYTGAPVVAGQFSQDSEPWAPIAAEQTASGYEVAWKVTGADQFMVWNTDNSGNFVSSALAPTSGASAALQPMEISFNQDLNGDGYLGLVLNGSSGGQTLTAGNSPTTIVGGPGDTLNGGAAADNFVFKAAFGSNTVNNFTPGVDTLQFNQSMFASASVVLSDAQPVGSDVVIAHDALNVVTLHNVQLANLHAADFHII